MRPMLLIFAFFLVLPALAAPAPKLVRHTPTVRVHFDAPAHGPMSTSNLLVPPLPTTYKA